MLTVDTRPLFITWPSLNFFILLSFLPWITVADSFQTKHRYLLLASLDTPLHGVIFCGGLNQLCGYF